MTRSKLYVLTDEGEVVADIEGGDRPAVSNRPSEDLIVRPSAEVIALGDSDDVVPETAELDCDTR